MRKYRQDHPEYAKAHQNDPRTKWSQWLHRCMKRYGVSNEWVGEKFIEQQGKCAICFRDIYYNIWGDRKDKTLSIHIDHDHATGKPRGLLCGDCNIALGRFLDNPTRLLSGYTYLTKYN